MRMNHSNNRRSIVLAAGILCLAGNAGAQGLIQTQGVLVATNGDTIPDNAGVPITGFTFGGPSALGDNCVLDESGNVFFRGRFVDVGGTELPFNDRALFYGSSRSNLRMLVRGGDQAPSMGTGVLLRTTTGSSSSISSNVRLSPDGRMFWGATVFDSTGTNGITSANDDVLFGGPFASQGILVQQGDAAPGTVGATFAQAFSSPSQQNSGINRNGRLYFQATLTGGDTTTTTGMNNQSGIWAGMPGALEMVARKSTPVSGLGGAVAIDTSATIGFVTMMNDSGNFLYEVVLSTTQGAPAATITNDRAIMVHSPGAGSLPLVREGDIAPGTAGGTFNAITADAWSPGFGSNSWTRTSETLFTTELRGGDVVVGTNDRAVYKGGVGTLAMVVRKGDPAPGTDAVFSLWNNTNCHLNANGRVLLQGALSGGTSTTTNDTGLWTGTPGSLVLVVREGQTMPGTGGSIAGGFSGTSTYFNDQGRPLFNVSLSGGTITGSSLWAWDATLGLIAVALPGDQIEVSTGVFKSISGFGGVSFSNTDGAPLFFGHDGRIGNRYSFSDGTNGIIIVRLPIETPSTPYCFGDGTGTACPCGNSGALGNGCANSLNANGANLVGSGLASIAGDTYLLSGSGMPNSSVLYFQGSTQLAGVPFGDGLRCTTVSVIRLGTQVNVAGASIYPDPSVSDLPVSVRAGITTAGTRFYQAWYRNADSTFCTTSTFNLTNGVRVTWAL